MIAVHGNDFSIINFIQSSLMKSDVHNYKH